MLPGQVPPSGSVPPQTPPQTPPRTPLEYVQVFLGDLGFLFQTLEYFILNARNIGRGFHNIAAALKFFFFVSKLAAKRLSRASTIHFLIRIWTTASGWRVKRR